MLNEHDLGHHVQTKNRFYCNLLNFDSMDSRVFVRFSGENLKILQHWPEEWLRIKMNYQFFLSLLGWSQHFLTRQTFWAIPKKVCVNSHVSMPNVTQWNWNFEFDFGTMPCSIRTAIELLLQLLNFRKFPIFEMTESSHPGIQRGVKNFHSKLCPKIMLNIFFSFPKKNSNFNNISLKFSINFSHFRFNT